MFKTLLATCLITVFALTTGASEGRFVGSAQPGASYDNGYILAQTQGSKKRNDRRDDRQDDRGDRQDDRQDCRQDEGAGKDKRDCKQDERQDRNSDG